MSALAQDISCSGCNTPRPDSRGRCGYCGGQIIQLGPVVPQARRPQLRGPRRKGILLSIEQAKQVDREDPWAMAQVARLEELIAEITAADAKRIEAHRLWAALHAYGVIEIPVLPWQTQINPATCALCGKVYTDPHQYKKIGETLVCRFSCQKREAPGG